MKITAVTEDQIIVIDGQGAEMRELGGYHMTNGEWAVHFDAEKGYGEIEYLDNRPNRRIYQDEFDAHYSWLITEHQRYQDHLAAQAAAYESETIITDGSDNSGGADVI